MGLQMELPSGPPMGLPSETLLLLPSVLPIRLVPAPPTGLPLEPLIRPPPEPPFRLDPASTLKWYRYRIRTKQEG
ncbi:hypothetical protein PDUR_23545 [Paenibacillus durus]|uniref:Uncharacterized protein n=1 Tax=Paenibacillus durus TaxID=44251 RepID=A0A089HTX7_PAEDU|nr:hypothetical protein PDUR_23545 [Paenibacillus durus]